MELIKDKEQWVDIEKLRVMHAPFQTICESCGAELECRDDLYILLGNEDETAQLAYYLTNISCPSCGKKLIYNRFYKKNALDISGELLIRPKQEKENP